MYKVGDLREVQERSTAGTGRSEATSILSKRVCTCVCSLWFFMVHTWMSSSSRLLRTPSRLSTKSKRWRQPSQIFKKRKLWIIHYLPILASCFPFTPKDLMLQQWPNVLRMKSLFAMKMNLIPKEEFTLHFDQTTKCPADILLVILALAQVRALTRTRLEITLSCWLS